MAFEVQGNIATETLRDNVRCVLFEQLTEVLDPEPHDAALNMAIDEVLLCRAITPQLRVYRWNAPAVSFGYFAPLKDVAAQWPERELVRRWTGGGAVPHGDDLTYTLVVPRSCAFFSRPLADSYRAIHARIASLLPDSRMSERTNPKVSNACFENFAQHDVIIDGRKIAGAAQRRTRFGVLHQGSIQFPAPADLAKSLAYVFAPNVARRMLSAEELEQAESIAREKYASEKWLRRC